MYVFKAINTEEVLVEENISHADVNMVITSVYKDVDTLGWSNQVFNSGSFNDKSTLSYTTSGNHYNFLHHNYYSSGSAEVSQSDTRLYDQLSTNPWNSLGWEYTLQGQYRNKFYNTGRVVYIPQNFYGERVKPNSFEMSVTTASKNIVIKDDGIGNLYGYSGVEHSQSINSLSSSNNYLGNIFYDNGVVVFTETGSWSGSSAIGEGFTYPKLIENNDLNIDFKATHKVFTKSWMVQIEPQEFNMTLNQTARAYYSGSVEDQANGNTYNQSGLWWAPGNLNNHFPNEWSGSNWSPHCTAIALYGEDTNIATGEPLIVAHLSQPIPMDSEVPIIFEISLDF